MSFDLFFTRPKISSNDFTSYFERRPHYKVSAKQAFYENPDTSVYFFFNRNESESSIELNINYFRPHYFILEIEPEVTAFVKHFGCTISDPQSAGMGEGPYSPAGLAKSWNHGNEFGYAAILKGPSRPNQTAALPTNRLEGVWRWNYTKAARQLIHTENRFVPGVFFLAVADKVATAAVWPDAISELIPETDYLVIARGRNDKILIPFSTVRDLLRSYYVSNNPMPAYELPPITPRQMQDFVKKIQPTGIAAKGIRADQVLNVELVKKYLE